MLRRSSIAFLVVCLWGAASAMADIVVNNIPGAAGSPDVSGFTSGGFDIGGSTNLMRAVGLTANQSVFFDRATFAISRNPEATSSNLTLTVVEDPLGLQNIVYQNSIAITSSTASAAVFTSGSVVLSAGFDYAFVLSGNTGATENLTWWKASGDNPYSVNESYVSFTDPAFLSFSDNFDWTATPELNQVGMRIEVSNVPEPSTWALMGLGVGVVAWRRRRKLKAKESERS